MTGLRISILALAAFPLAAQNLQEFEKKVSEFTLANGMHFIVAARRDAPVVSFHSYVNAGSVNDPSGATGIAHMFEHMAFKGDESIGSRDWPAEKKAMEEIEQAYDRLEAERNKGPKASETAVKTLETQLRMAIDRAHAYVEPNEYTRIIEENGGAGLNAGTGVDSTQYYYSLPSNRAELWFLMESRRFLRPVFREFYKERDVVMEEYRMRVESSPQGMLLQTFGAAAFEAHPYHNPPGGWPSDIDSLRTEDARRFFDTYYAPGNITVGIVGDIDAAEAKRLAEKYFGPIPKRPLPPLLRTAEPPQSGPKTAAVESAAQPLLVFGYKRPDQYDKDDPVFDILSMILSRGRTSWMYKELVQDKRIALAAQTVATYPGSRYPNLFLFFAAPSQGHGVEENQKAIDALIERIRTRKVDQQTLERVKAQARVEVLRRLDSNQELATLLTLYYANFGDWRKLFTTLDEYKAVTADDVQRVAAKYLTPQNRTSAWTAQPARASKGGAQ